MEPLYIGIKGHVVAIDRATGGEIWRRHLAGASYVTVHAGAGAVYAGARGTLFCLDPTTGSVIWTNNLRGLGYNLIMFSGSDVASAISQLSSQRRASS